MTEPLVCCVMLTKDRPEMAKRAVECFRSQTYQRKCLLIFDTSEKIPDWGFGYDEQNILHRFQPLSEYAPASRTIGHLRNCATAYAIASREKSGGWPRAATIDVFIHWDDDDWSHPNRITEQVALLQASGKQAVGYRDMLFWKRDGPRWPKSYSAPYADKELIWTEEAWLYSNADPRFIVGSSLAYWRETWEKRPFRASPENREARGEDMWFIMDRDTLGVSSVTKFVGNLVPPNEFTPDPRMICSIHGANSTSYEGIEKSGNWKRVSEWDEHCKKVMSL